MPIELIGRGEKITYFAVVRGGDCEFKGFIDSLQEKDLKKVLPLLANVQDHGIPRNKQKFKHVEDQIYEFKSDKVRLLGYFGNQESGRSFIFVLGYMKQKQRTPKAILEKVKRIREEEGGQKNGK